MPDFDWGSFGEAMNRRYGATGTVGGESAPATSEPVTASSPEFNWQDFGAAMNRRYGASTHEATPVLLETPAPASAFPEQAEIKAPETRAALPEAIAPQPAQPLSEDQFKVTGRLPQAIAPAPIRPSASAPTEMSTPERLGRHFVSGALGTAEGMGGALQWVTGGALGKDFSDYMGVFRKQVTPEGEASFVDQLASGAGSMATFFIPGFGVARGLGLAARVAPKAAAWLGAGTMAVTEAATEAGQVYRDELGKGKDEGKAGSAANWTFWLNLPVLTLTDKLAFFGGQGKALSRALRGMVTEGSQESLQEVISTWSKEEQQNLKNIMTSGAIGAVMGGGLGAIAKAPGGTEAIPKAEPVVETETQGVQESVVQEQVPVLPTSEAVPESTLVPEIERRAPQPATLTSEAQHQAIFGGDLGQTIEAQVNRADAVRALVPKLGDQARAERFVDLYQKGDAATALKEFPEHSTLATEQQKAAAITPAEREAATPPQPMPTAGSTAPVAESELALGFTQSEEVKVGVTQPVGTHTAPVNPAGRSNEGGATLPPEAPSSPPRVRETSSGPGTTVQAQAGGTGNVGVSIAEAKPKVTVTPAESAVANQPMGSGVGRGKAAPETPTTTSAPEGIAPANAPGAFVEGKQPEITPEVEAARVALAQERGVNPEELKYKGVWPESEGIPGQYMFDYTLPENGLATGWMWPIAGKGAVAPENLGTTPTQPLAPPETVASVLSGEVAPEGQAPSTSAVPEGVTDFMSKYGSRQGPPEGLLTGRKKGKGADYQRALERNDLAALLHNIGGIDPKAYAVTGNFNLPEEKMALGRTVLKTGGLAPDIAFEEAKTHFPDQFGHFTDAEDMLRYFVDGRYQKFLNSKSIEQQFEDHYADIEEQAAREGISPEALARVEADVEREIATEREAIRSESSAGTDTDTSWDAAAALGLSPKKKPASRLETRLNELQADYPTIDRDKASLVIRSQPGATNDQVANMVADPEMFRRVAQGNMAATEQSKPRGGETQGALPGITDKGNTLFRIQNLEAKLDHLTKPELNYALSTGIVSRDVYDIVYAPKYGEWGGQQWARSFPDFADARMEAPRAKVETQAASSEPSITPDTLQQAFGPKADIQEGVILPDTYTVTLPNGRRILVRQNATIEIEPEALRAYGKTELGESDYIAGEWRQIGKDGMISLAKGEGTQTLNHEIFHAAEDMVLTLREIAILEKKYGDVEARARAYEDWNPKGHPNTVFQKIMDFFRNIYRSIFPNAESVFEQVRAGKVWERGGLPEALAPSKYRIKKEGESDTDHMLATYLPGYETAGKIKQGIQSLVLATAKSPEHLRAGELLGAKLGTLHRATESSAKRLEADSKAFDKMGVHNQDIPLDQNPGPQFMSDVSQGRPVSPEMQPTVDRINALNQDRLVRLAEAGVPVESVRENYFGMIWKKDSIRAFNQALHEAIADGRGRAAAEGGLGEHVTDLNTWNPSDAAWVKARTQELLKTGGGSDTSALQYLARRPFEGSESFRKEKVFDDVMTGVNFGLEPISNNPIDIVKLKLAEMDRSIMANSAIKDWKESGDIQFNHISKKVPEGWAKINDKYGTVYGPYDPATGTKP